MPPYADVLKYINTTLKEKFHLDDQPATKPVMSVDDLFLGLTHHWSRDRSTFPTEDDRLDLPTIMLFQAYTACRPAELVDGTKCRGATDPLLDDSDVEDPGGDRAADVDAAPWGTRQRSKPGRFESRIRRKRATSVESESDFDSDADADEPIFDSDDESSGDDTSDTEYSDDANEDVDMLQEKLEACPLTAIAEDSDRKEATRQHKALCYEDIVLWIVKDPNVGGRDVLAMEVFFRHHKGADRKPKP